MTRRRTLIRAVLVALGACVAGGPAHAQARPPLPLRSDSTGALSAIRAVDYRQLCRCPNVMLDSLVRLAPRVQVFGILSQPPGVTLSRADAARLRLARHRVARTGFRTLPGGARDTVFVIVQIVGSRLGAAAERQVAVVATPPNGIVATYLVHLTRRGTAWRVLGVRSLLEP